MKKFPYNWVFTCEFRSRNAFETIIKMKFYKKNLYLLQRKLSSKWCSTDLKYNISKNCLYGGKKDARFVLSRVLIIIVVKYYPMLHFFFGLKHSIIGLYQSQFLIFNIFLYDRVVHKIIITCWFIHVLLRPHYSIQQRCNMCPFSLPIFQDKTLPSFLSHFILIS